MKNNKVLLRTVCACALALLAIAARAQQLPGGKLTVDSALQSLAKQLLQGKQGSIVAIEPQTGRVLAMVSRDKVDDGVNRAIGMTYSPGSTFKTAQALEMVSEGTLTAATTYPCRKGFYYNKVRIGCHEHPSPLSLVQAIGQSCNSYFCKAFQEMVDNREAYPSQFAAIDRWHAYMRSFGLGTPLGIDMEGEAGGTVPDAAWLGAHHPRWNGTTIMWMGMGQGEITTTPLQLCNLAAMIANRGWWITPHIHEQPVVAPDVYAAASQQLPTDSTYLRRHYGMATKEAIDLVVKGIRACVVSGTAASINRKDYDACGKTGTAENEGHDHSAFMGFAPMDNPRVAVSVYVENGGFGADLAAPLASLIMEQAVNGHLSAASQKKAEKWANKTVKITPVEKEISFDDL